jgi:hypothetical protein
MTGRHDTDTLNESSTSTETDYGRRIRLLNGTQEEVNRALQEIRLLPPEYHVSYMYPHVLKITCNDPLIAELY